MNVRIFPSRSTTTGSVGGFWRARLGSFLAVVPLGVWTFIHLWNNLAAFQGGEGDFFLISLKAGGFGLNLTMADYVIIADPWWNPAAEAQAIDRTHRIGQKNKVIAYRLLTRDTVEEKIRILQHQKTQLVTNVLGDEGFASNLGLDDLQFILTHNIDEEDEIGAAK